MYLQHLHLINFKNFESAQIHFSDGINCFVGENGAGKTNLLDAIYYLSFCKSYFGSIDSQHIRHHEDFYVIQGQYERQGEAEHIYCGLKRNHKKQFRRNKKDYEKLADHIGLLPLVMISPADEQLITEGAEERRRYMDGVISQYDRDYLYHLLRYNRLIVHRNALLKQLRDQEHGNLSVLEVIDEQLAKLGTFIYQRRMQFIETLMPVFERYYRFLSGGSESVGLGYVSGLFKYTLFDGLVDARSRDLALGYTSRGIHKDEIELLLGGYPLKRVGSQGQKKSFLIALKLAQFEFLAKHNGIKPILLLDDILDKLDRKRSGNLLELVARDQFEQIFITDTNRLHLTEMLGEIGKEYKVFTIENGTVTPESHG